MVRVSQPRVESRDFTFAVATGERFTLRRDWPAPAPPGQAGAGSQGVEVGAHPHQLGSGGLQVGSQVARDRLGGLGPSAGLGERLGALPILSA